MISSTNASIDRRDIVIAVNFFQCIQQKCEFENE